MKIKFKNEEFNAENNNFQYVEYCISIEEIKTIGTAQGSMFIALKDGRELCSDTPIQFVD